MNIGQAIVILVVAFVLAIAGFKYGPQIVEKFRGASTQHHERMAS